MAKVTHLDGPPETFAPAMTIIKLPEEAGSPLFGPEQPKSQADLDQEPDIEATSAYMGARARALALDPECDDGKTIVRSNN